MAIILHFDCENRSATVAVSFLSDAENDQSQCVKRSRGFIRNNASSK